MLFCRSSLSTFAFVGMALLLLPLSLAIGDEGDTELSTLDQFVSLSS